MTRTLIEADAEVWRRTGRAVPHVPNGCDQQGRYVPAAEAATDLGAEDDDRDSRNWMLSIEGSGALLWPVVGALVLAALGFGVSVLLPLIKT